MYSIIRTDIKNILRDPSLLLICFVPFLILALLRLGFPALQNVWPEADEYASLGLAMFCITVAIMPGIAVAFAMLDEKDNNLDTVLQILPVSYKKITWYRMGLIFGFGFISAMLLLIFSGIPSGNTVQKFLLAILTASSAPLMAIIPAFFAQNKIEGATYTKLLNFLIILPLPAFLFPGLWSWFMMIFPAWWIYFAFTGTDNNLIFILAIAGGIIVHTAAIFILMRKIFKAK
jgi:fluoroquinolone transport system permease protein